MKMSWCSAKRTAGVVMAVAALVVAAPARAGETLWYDEPATSWEQQALPIGNGAMGAAIFGGVGSERVQFNEKTLWTGGPGSAGGYTFGNWEQPRPNAIADVQRTLEEQLQMDPPDVAQALGQPKRGFGAYQTFGDVTLQIANEPGAVQDYRRELDIAGALARVSYSSGGVRYTREYFASRPGGAIVMRLSADRPGKVGFTASVTVPGQPVSDRHGARRPDHGRRGAAGQRAPLRVPAAGDEPRREPHRRRRRVGHRRRRRLRLLVLAAGTNYSDRYPDYRGADPHQAGQRRRRPRRRQALRAAAGSPRARSREAVRPCPPRHRAGDARRPDRRAAAGLPRRRLGGRPRAGGPVLPVRALPADRVLARRARCPPTSRASGTSRRARRGAPTTTSTSTCR